MVRAHLPRGVAGAEDAEAGIWESRLAVSRAQYGHMDLLLGMGGHLLNGYGALLCGGLLLSGLWLWWPALRAFRKQWAARVRVQRGASYRRLIHDLHNVFGIYAVPVLLVSVLTGAMFVFWEPVQTVVYRLTRSPADPSPIRVSSPRLRLSLDRALALGGGLVPEAHPTRLYPATGPGKPFRVLLEFPEGHPSHGAFAQVYLDPDSGAALRIEDPRSASLGSQLMGSIGPLHFGTWAGCFGGWPKLAMKSLYMLAGLAPLALFVTGVLKYFEKRKAKHKNWIRQHRAGKDSRAFLYEGDTA